MMDSKRDNEETQHRTMHIRHWAAGD